ncbi:MAG: T9SS type A sorting domain-containing protein, partial [Candidatus Muiribacteriota bacterium]
GNETIVRFSFSNVNLKSGPNYIKADAVDNLGNILKPFVISTQLITVIYDNIPPTGTYGLKILENKQSYAVIAWEAFNDEYSNPVDYSIQIAIEESFSTIIATHSTMSTQYQISLEDYPYSAYYVRVIAKDSLGNAAEPSKHVIISMDKQSPIVSLLTVLDNSPDSTSSPLYPDFKPQTGDLSLVIQFNEKMDKTVDLSKDGNIRVRLEGNYSFKIENGRWASDYTWVSNISKNSFGNGYSSYFKFVVKGAKDVAGNEMQMITSKEYYLYNVPEIEKPKIFPNPLDDREIMILLKPLQTLQTNPRVKIDGKDVEFNLLTRSWYGASHRIMSNQTGIKSIQVTITDLNGNVGHWPDDYEQIADFNFNLFKTASLTNNSPVMLSSVDEKAVLTVPANSVVEDTDIYTLNFEDEEIGQSNAPSFAPVSNINRIELEKLSSNIAFAPAVKLNNNAEIEFELPTDSSNGLCIMRKVGSAWVYVPTEIRENKVAGIVDSLGTFGLFRDNIAPEVNKNIKNGDVLTDGKKTIDVTLSENGSGVKSVRLYLNGKLVGEEKGVSKILYSPATYYREGDNEFVVEAEDNAGNKSLNKTIFRAPGAISFNSIRVYPNPVNDMAEFSFNLDSVASQISLRIYSVDGRLVYRDGLINMQNGVFFWFGNDLRGRNVSNGTYIYEIEAKGNGVGKTKGKIAVLR